MEHDELQVAHKSDASLIHHALRSRYIISFSPLARLAPQLSHSPPFVTRPSGLSYGKCQPKTEKATQPPSSTASRSCAKRTNRARMDPEKG